MNDFLILLWNCPDCVKLKMAIDFNNAFVENLKGKNSHSLNIYYSFTNSGFNLLLKQFNINNIDNIFQAPILINDGHVINNIEEIISYINTNY